MKSIPIRRAKELAEKYDYDMVIITAINCDNSGMITTYGKTKLLCKISGKMGDNIGKQIFNGCKIQNVSKSAKDAINKYKTNLLHIFDGYHIDWVDTEVLEGQICLSFRVWIHPCQYKFVINIFNKGTISVKSERLGSTNPSTDIELQSAKNIVDEIENNIKEMEIIEWL